LVESTYVRTRHPEIVKAKNKIVKAIIYFFINIAPTLLQQFKILLQLLSLETICARFLSCEGSVCKKVFGGRSVRRVAELLQPVFTCNSKGYPSGCTVAGVSVKNIGF
jgi:hypothetical protein